MSREERMLAEPLLCARPRLNRFHLNTRSQILATILCGGYSLQVRKLNQGIRANARSQRKLPPHFCSQSYSERLARDRRSNGKSVFGPR